MSDGTSKRNWIMQSALTMMGIPALFKNSYILPVNDKEDKMAHYLCSTCGTQYEASAKAPEHCPVCEDDRQYVNPGG